MKIASRTFIVSIVLVAIFSVAYNLSHRDPALGSTSRDWKRIFQIIDENYVDNVDHYACFEKTQSGGISACLDRFSEYFSGKEWKEFSSMVNGRYAGVGMTMKRDGTNIHLFPYPGMPASKAGILPNDVLLQVDSTKITQEEDASENELRRAANLVRGEPGTTVHVTVKRGDAIIGPLFIVREKIVVPSVLYKRIAPTIGYVRIGQFGESTATDFLHALDDLTDYGEDKNMSFIFDVRGNPGGLVDTVVAMLEDMAPTSNDLIITLKYKTRSEEKKAGKEGRFGYAHGVILTDGFSASASEIFAGTLQDWGNFKLVGGKTYGKGVGQVIVPLYRWQSDSPVLKLTTFHYLVGNNRKPVLAKKGLAPDYPVEGALASGDIERFKKDMASHDPTKPYLNLEIDKSLKKALELLSK